MELYILRQLELHKTSRPGLPGSFLSIEEHLVKSELLFRLTLFSNVKQLVIAFINRIKRQFSQQFLKRSPRPHIDFGPNQGAEGCAEALVQVF